MFELRKYEDKKFFMLRWTARVFDAVCLAILFLFIFSEGSDWSRITVKQMIGLLFFPVGLIVGLILAWWKEIFGGAIVVGCVAAFYTIYGGILNSSVAGQGWWFIVFAIPGALFLVYGIGVSGGQSVTQNKIKI